MSFLGSVGGLEYNFDVIGGYLCAWLAAINAKYFFNNQLYRVHKKDHKKKRVISVSDRTTHKKSPETWRSAIASDYVNREATITFSFIRYAFNCCCQWKRHNRDQRMLEKGEHRMTQELDILNHLRSTRLHSLQIRTLLTKKQNAFSRKLAEYILTDEETESDHGTRKTKKATPLVDLNLKKNKVNGLSEKFQAAFQSKFNKQIF